MSSTGGIIVRGISKSNLVMDAFCTHQAGCFSPAREQCPGSSCFVYLVYMAKRKKCDWLKIILFCAKMHSRRIFPEKQQRSSRDFGALSGKREKITNWRPVPLSNSRQQSSWLRPPLCAVSVRPRSIGIGPSGTKHAAWLRVQCTCRHQEIETAVQSFRTSDGKNLTALASPTLLFFAPSRCSDNAKFIHTFTLQLDQHA